MADAMAATRALWVLSTLARAGAPMTAVSIAKRLDLPRSSTYHLLTAMQAQGFVIHYPEESRWGLGISAFELGSAYLRHDPLERLARPILSKLVHEVETSVAAVGHLAILQGTETLYLLRELPRRPLQLVTEVGVRLPANLTASGCAMLAQLPTAQVQALYSQLEQLPDRTGQGPTTLPALTGHLADCRKAGFASEDGHITPGYSGLSVPVLNHLGFPTAALNLTFSSDSADGKLRYRMTQALTLAAKELSRKLGHHG